MIESSLDHNYMQPLRHRWVRIDGTIPKHVVPRTILPPIKPYDLDGAVRSAKMDILMESREMLRTHGVDTNKGTELEIWIDAISCRLTKSEKNYD